MSVEGYAAKDLVELGTLIQATNREIKVKWDSGGQATLIATSHLT